MVSEIIPDAELDCVGLYCPMPIAQTKEEIDKLEDGQVLKKVDLRPGVKIVGAATLNDLALDAAATMWF